MRTHGACNAYAIVWAKKCPEHVGIRDIVAQLHPEKCGGSFQQAAGNGSWTSQNYEPRDAEEVTFQRWRS